MEEPRNIFSSSSTEKELPIKETLLEISLKAQEALRKLALFQDIQTCALATIGSGLFVLGLTIL